MSKHKGVPQMDPFDQTPGNDVTTVTNEIYGLGGNSKLETGRVVAQPIRIYEIWADVTQPRRSVPTNVRGDWNGDPATVPALFNRWKVPVAAEIDRLVDTRRIIQGEENPFTAETYSTTTEKFRKLVNLALSIYKTQLDQPIGISKRDDDSYLIVFGERRWLAYHLLNMIYPDDKYQRIPARMLDGSDFDLAKSQAEENMQRSDLNAISKARQFAKLVMEARVSSSEADYLTHSTLVSVDGCDRRYYAQVADGDEHSIPYGKGTEFESALNISTGQMRQYRGLLRLTDDEEVNDLIWTLGDDNDWAESFMRDLARLDVDFLRETLRSVTTVTVLEAEKALRQAIAAEKQPKPTPATSQVDRAMPSADRAEWPHDEPTKRVEAPVRSRPLPPMQTNKWRIGDWVQTRTGRVGKVVGISGRYANVQDKTGIRQHDQDSLERAEEPAQEAESLPGEKAKEMFGMMVLTPGDKRGRVIKVEGEWLTIQFIDGSAYPRHYTTVTLDEDQSHFLDEAARTRDAMLQKWVGKRIRSKHAGWEAVVTGIVGTHLKCETDSGRSYTVPPDGVIVIESPEMDLRTDDERVPDNASSQARAVPLLDDQPEDIRQLVYNLRGLAIGLGERRVQKHIDQLIAMSNVDLVSEASMNADATKATLTDYANDIAHLLENAQQTFESYLEWIGQAVDELREDGA